jgi:hypothetical protein
MGILGVSIHRALNTILTGERQSKVAKETPKQRLVRMFGLGKYGETVADEVLTEHTDHLIQELRAAGLGLAAVYLEMLRDTKHW